MNAERGAALIVALLLLSFLTVLGGALLSHSTLDVWISDNYRTAAQNLYLTEAGIEHAFEQMRAAEAAPSSLLMAAAGSDGMLSAAVDLASLLASDDVPLIPPDPASREAGQALPDGSGRTAGRYHVWLKNDHGDGMTSTADTNQVLTLLSFGRIGNARKAIEVTARKWEFPRLAEAVTLDGPVTLFDTSGAAFAVGAADDSQLEPRLKTVAGLESIVARIHAVAEDTFSPAPGTAQAIGNLGMPQDYRVAVVHGDAEIGPGTGYGLLVVRGEAVFAGNFSWHGLILVIGQGVLRWNSGAYGTIEGGVFLARTHDAGGMLRSSRGGVTADFRGAGGAGIQYNPAAIAAAHRGFPYIPTAIKEK